MFLSAVCFFIVLDSSNDNYIVNVSMSSISHLFLIFITITTIDQVEKKIGLVVYRTMKSRVY